MVELVVVAAGFLLGLAVGRWWALVAAAGLGVWVWQNINTDEVAESFAGAGYGLIAAVGIAAGVALRKRAGRSRPAPP